MPSSQPNTLLEVGAQLLAAAKAAGADAADVYLGHGVNFEVKVADGKIVTLSQAESRGAGLRVFANQALGFCTIQDFSPAALRTAAQRAVSLAKVAAADASHRLPSAPPLQVGPQPQLQLFDPAIAQLQARDKVEMAHRIEAAARAACGKIKTFRDSGVASQITRSALLSSSGTACSAEHTAFSLWSVPVAEDNGQLQTESWYDAQVCLADCQSPEAVGEQAAARVSRMLGARPIKTTQAPVIFEHQFAAGFLGSLVAALDGYAVYKNASFLGPHLHQQIGSPLLSLIDDPHAPKAFGSSAFDGEGLPTSRTALLDKGVLTQFLYDTYSASKAGSTPTASAQRGTGSLPGVGPFNLVVPAGQTAFAELVDVERALLVTRGLGAGLNTVSGEYSRGVNGLWIEKGQIVHPVQEVTIAGDYLQMLKEVEAVGNDAVLRGGSGAPSIRLRNVAIGGA